MVESAIYRLKCCHVKRDDLQAATNIENTSNFHTCSQKMITNNKHYHTETDCLLSLMNNKSAPFAFRLREHTGTAEDLRCKYRAKIRNLKIEKQTTGFCTKKSAFPLLVWSVALCGLYITVKTLLWVSIQLWWLLHISCLIVNFTTLSDIDEPPQKRSVGLHVNLQSYSVPADCRHIFDVTISLSNFHSDFHFPRHHLNRSL